MGAIHDCSSHYVLGFKWDDYISNEKLYEPMVNYKV